MPTRLILLQYQEGEKWFQPRDTKWFLTQYITSVYVKNIMKT